MIIIKTPFRISFVGGGSDIEDFYTKSPGAVLSVSINKFMYISSHYFFDKDKIRIKYSETETAHTVNDVKHPIVKEILKKFKIDGAVEISSNADVPAGIGLGSSSAFTVGLLHNLYVQSGKFVSAARLAKEASEIEIDILKEPIGKQDQYATAFGGLNIIKFDASGSVSVESLHLQEDEYKNFQNNLLMFYIGNQRKTSEILQEQKDNMSSENKVQILCEMVDLVWEMKKTLYSGNIDYVGKLLHKNWQLKQRLASKITNDKINDMYELALKNGALGGKLLGAGGGGFLLFYCPKSQQKRLREALHNIREMKFKFENEGSRIIYVGDEYNER